MTDSNYIDQSSHEVTPTGLSEHDFHDLIMHEYKWLGDTLGFTDDDSAALNDALHDMAHRILQQKLATNPDIWYTGDSYYFYLSSFNDKIECSFDIDFDIRRDFFYCPNDPTNDAPNFLPGSLARYGLPEWRFDSVVRVEIILPADVKGDGEYPLGFEFE